MYCADNDDPDCCDDIRVQGLDDMNGVYHRHSKFGFDGSYMFQRYSDDQPPVANGYIKYERNIPNFMGNPVPDRWVLTSQSLQ